MIFLLSSKLPLLNHCRYLSGLRHFDRPRRTLASPIEGKLPKVCGLDEAVSEIKSGENIYLHHACSMPIDLCKSLGIHVLKNNLNNIKVTHALTCGDLPWIREEFYGKIRSRTIFICNNMRPLVNKGFADYIPLFLSDTARLFDEKAIPVDTALLNLSPPDKHGYCSLGINVDLSSPAARNAKKIIATINTSQPKTFGDSEIHISQIDYLIKEDNLTPIFELPVIESNNEEKLIGKWIAENLIDNGATLQMGIGSIPNNVLNQLKNHQNLGVHSEMISDGITELINLGVINNSQKRMYPGKIVTCFAMGSKQFYEFLDGNPLFLFGSAGFTNSINTIIQQSKMTAINSAIEIDLTGQVVSDTIGKRFYSGFGGQVDFIFGSSAALDGLGKAIIALPSRTSKGEPKIVPCVKEGSGIVTTKAHCNYVVTEYGIANLWAKTICQRAYNLIKIAHPDDREMLEKEAFKRFGFIPSKD
ncbi:AcetylCoA_hyd_C domain-containing protein [Meloidogyne graminicola]|uniref:AcetylCoA_hyd_C domain-containing protein n=1 Tax=Meloidogyne graminicola TaxID=189291 RepID=A0A8S9ZIU6_9BILA|nr:AcetylCoA_hyd_C domain-containing protein [Meloidogyne graminicola]